MEEESLSIASDYFAKAIDRKGTDAEKYVLRHALFGREDLLPMWVADQDLPTPPFIIAALQQRLNHPILGYTHTPDRVLDRVVAWQAQYGYRINPAHLIFTHNVANGLFLAVQALSQVGDGVVIMPPIYPPFEQAIRCNERQPVAVPLRMTSNPAEYVMDFDGLANAFSRPEVSLCLLCNPHNPSGRVWTSAELTQLAELALVHNVSLVSDEIHGDLTLPPYQHCPLASLGDDIAQQTLTLSSPGKTFNLAGLQIGYAIAANPQHRAAFQAAAARVKIDELNLFALVALEAAYSDEGKAWRDALCQQLLVNIDRLQACLATACPKLRLMRPQASYLVWLDFNPLIPDRFEDHTALQAWLINEARLGLNSGLSYGEAGRGFMRINLAVSAETLDQACNQLQQAFNQKEFDHDD